MTKWFEINDVGRVQLEITNYCNAACPYCERALRPKDQLNNSYMSLDTLKKFFDPYEWLSLHQIHLCGNVDEPTIHPQLFEIIDYFLGVSHNNSTHVTISTNGGARDEEFWTELGKVSSANKVSVLWGIDGLEDTNHLYRVGVKWNTLMRNVKAFISAGGHASWQFIVFDHNKHQIDEAKALAKELGFRLFKTISSNRIPKEEQSQRPSKIKPEPVKFYKEHEAKTFLTIPPQTRRANLIKPVFEKKEYVEKTRVDMVVEEKKSFNIFVPIHGIKPKVNAFKISLPTRGTQTHPEITCAAKPWSHKKHFSHDGIRANIYMTHEGLVYPCCWVTSKRGLTELKQTAFGIPTEDYSIHHNELVDIINGEMWTHIDESMDQLRCGYMCKNSIEHETVDINQYTQL